MTLIKGKGSVQAELSHSMSTKRQLQKRSITHVNARDEIQSVRSVRKVRTRLTRSPRLPDTYYLDTRYWIHKLMILGYHGAWLLILIPDGTRVILQAEQSHSLDVNDKHAFLFHCDLGKTPESRNPDQV